MSGAPSAPTADSKDSEAAEVRSASPSSDEKEKSRWQAPKLFSAMRAAANGLLRKKGRGLAVSTCRELPREL